MGDDGPNSYKHSGSAIETCPSQCEWLAQTRSFKFQLGEVSIGSVRLPALTLSTYFMRLVGGPPEPPLPFVRFPRGTDLVVAGSYPVPESLPRLSILPHAIRYVPNQYWRHYVDLSGTFEAYLDKFSSKSRSTLRKKIRKFAEHSGGEISWRVFRAEAMEDFHRHAFEVSKKTYQARLHFAAALPEIVQFRRQAVKYDDARGYLLFHGDKPIAYVFCPAKDGNLLYQFVGHDPDYQQWSPGTILQYLALESVFAENQFRSFDFTEGEGAHKEFFSNCKILCADIYYFCRTPRNFMIVALHAGLRAVSRESVRVLDRLGLKARIKKLIRSRA